MQEFVFIGMEIFLKSLQIKRLDFIVVKYEKIKKAILRGNDVLKGNKDIYSLKTVIKDYYQKLKSSITVRWGSLPPAFYEIGWMASLTSQNGKFLFTDWIDYLIITQRKDGSWGYSSEGIRARFLTTFRIFSVLSQQRHPSEKIKIAVEKARHWLESHQHGLSSDWQDPIGYELLLPSQINEAELLGLDITIDSSPHLKALQRALDRKISFFREQIFTPHSTIAHSCEFFGDSVLTSQLEQMQSLNGSLGNSPSATAFLLKRDDLNPQVKRMAFRYLKFVLDENRHPVKIFPVDLVELIGVLFYLSFDPNFCLMNWHSVLERILSHLQHNKFVSAASTYPVVDLDDTAMAYITLARLNWKTPFVPNIEQFEERSHYRTFFVETGVSIATQVHLFWWSIYSQNESWMEKSLSYLRNKTKWWQFESWCDKFAPSPWYSISHLVLALNDHQDEDLWPEFINQTYKWIQDRQNPNGSYGVCSETEDVIGTVEETSLVLLIMNVLKKKWKLDVKRHQVVSALEFIISELLKNRPYYSITWMGKAGLYSLDPVVKSLVTAVLANYLDLCA